MRACLLLLVLILVSSSLTPAHGQLQKYLINMRLVSDDLDNVLTLRLLEDEVMTVTYGTKDLIVSSTGRWQVDGDRMQLLEGDTQKVLFDFDSLRWGKGTLRARDRDGKELVFLYADLPRAICKLEEKQASVEEWRNAEDLDSRSTITKEDLQRKFFRWEIPHSERASLLEGVDKYPLVEHYKFEQNFHALVFFSEGKAVKVIKW